MCGGGQEADGVWREGGRRLMVRGGEGEGDWRCGERGEI